MHGHKHLETSNVGNILRIRKVNTMKKLIVLFVLLTGLCAAQTTVTISVTIPASAVPVVKAWLASQCTVFTKDVNGDNVVCSTPTYPDVKAYLSAVLTPQITVIIKQALDWAVANGDLSLPNPVQTAIANKKAADATLAGAATAAAPVVLVQ
jgi:hypothetical protein